MFLKIGMTRKKMKCFAVDNVIMCLTSTNGRISHVVVVPKLLRKTVLKLAHDMSGNFGIGVNQIFY